MANGPDPRGDTIQALLGGLSRSIPHPTADSIFRVLGLPERPLEFDRDLPANVLGRFNTADRTIGFNERVREGDRSVTLAHELAHQATTAGEPSSDIQGFMNLFMQRFGDETPETRQRVLQNEFGVPVDTSVANLVFDIGPESAEVQELMGEALEGGFRLARQADPQTPGSISDLLTQEDNRIPGTREAFNLFMRRLQGGN